MTLRVLLPLFSPGACFASALGAARVLSVLVFGVLGVAWVVEFVTLGACARAVLAGHPVPAPAFALLAVGARVDCVWFCSPPHAALARLFILVPPFPRPAFHLRRLGAISGPRRGKSTALQAGALAKKRRFM